MSGKKNRIYALINSKKQKSKGSQSVSLGGFAAVINEYIQGDNITQSLLKKLKSDDTLVIENIEVLGNTIDEIVTIINSIWQNNINLCLAEENLSFKADKLPEFASSLEIASKIHRKLISVTTRKALKEVKAKGKKLGQLVGAVLTKKLDHYKEEIRQMLANGASKSSIAKRYNVCWETVSNFVKKNPELLLGKN